MTYYKAANILNWPKFVKLCLPLIQCGILNYNSKVLLMDKFTVLNSHLHGLQTCFQVTVTGLTLVINATYRARDPHPTRIEDFINKYSHTWQENIWHMTAISALICMKENNNVNTEWLHTLRKVSWKMLCKNISLIE